MKVLSGDDDMRNVHHHLRLDSVYDSYLVDLRNKFKQEFPILEYVTS